MEQGNGTQSPHSSRLTAAHTRPPSAATDHVAARAPSRAAPSGYFQRDRAWTDFVPWQVTWWGGHKNLQHLNASLWKESKHGRNVPFSLQSLPRNANSPKMASGDVKDILDGVTANCRLFPVSPGEEADGGTANSTRLF